MSMLRSGLGKLASSKLLFRPKVRFGDFDLSNGPDLIEIEPTIGCNLRCRMCHVPYMKEKLAWLPIDKIDWSFCRDRTVTIGATFEPTIHPDFNRLISVLNDVNAEIVMITNAANLDRKQIPALFDSKLKMVTFSFDGISKEVYEEIRVGGNFDRTLKNIENLVQAFKGRDTIFAVNFTVLRSALGDVPGAPAFWAERGINVLGLIGMVVREDNAYILENDLSKCQDEYFAALEGGAINARNDKLDIVVASSHLASFSSEYPKTMYFGDENKFKLFSVHQEFEIKKNSPFNNNCVSPLTSARITWDGAVHLCHDQCIGNVMNDKFENIWLSYRANKLRSRISANGKLCEKCDYYKFCLNTEEMDAKKSSSYYSQKFTDSHPDIATEE